MSGFVLFHISKEHQITTVCQGELGEGHCFTFQKSIKSQPWRDCAGLPRIVSHFKRASNHNCARSRALRSGLFHISKEHQITTRPASVTFAMILFHISKEHQITTSWHPSHAAGALFHISKEHQITTLWRVIWLNGALFHISKEHQIT